MVPKLARIKPRHIGRTACYLVGLLWTSLLARGQDTERQLQQLKEQVATFEQRISVLEQQLEKEKEAKGQRGGSGGPSPRGTASSKNIRRAGPGEISKIRVRKCEAGRRPIRGQLP